MTTALRILPVLLLLACSSSERSEPAPETLQSPGASSSSSSSASPAPTSAQPAQAQPNANSPSTTAESTPASPPGTAKGHRRLGPADAAAFKAYKKALAQGRKLANKGEHERAIPHFQDALKHAPGDPAANSELGWSAFRTGDLALAESATRASIKRAQKSTLMAASLYNLGRILEQQGDRTGAEGAYTRSLSLRPNKTVQKRLAGLRGQVAAAEEVLSVTRLDGPYPSIEAVCQHFKEEETPRYRDKFECGPAQPPEKGSDESFVTRVASGKPPILDVQLVEYGVASECALAIQVDGGWYTTSTMIFCDSTYGTRVVSLNVLQGAGSAVLDARFIQRWTGRDSITDEEGDEYTFSFDMLESRIMLCTVGTAGSDEGVPLCASPIEVDGWSEGFIDSLDEIDEPEDEEHDDGFAEVKVQLNAKGALIMSGSPGWYKGKKALLGKYQLQFQ